MNRIVVLGGSGFVGRALCRRLAARWPALRVLVPTRRLPHAQALRTLPTVDIVPADVNDPAALPALLAGADAVVNLVAILHGTEAAFEQAHVVLPRHLAAAARAAGVGRLVHVSALGVASDAPSMYLRSKARGEQVLRDGGLPLSLLRPSVIFGAEDRFLNLFAELQALAPVLPLAGSSAHFQPVWVEDVAEALVRVLAATPGSTPPVIECAGPQVFTLSELVRLAGRWAGHERPQIPLPLLLARLQAALMEWAPGPTLMSRDNVDSMGVPNVAGGALPGLDALGIAPASVESVMPALLAGRGGRSHLDALRARR
jgi:NADH dehydrogenase